MKTFAEILQEQDLTQGIEESDLDRMAQELTWDDIADLYDADELIEVSEDEQDLGEAISAQSRLSKKMAFARKKAKRQTLKGIKLRRASDFATLKKRATNAARRALQKRLLRGRDKSTLSAQEKDRIETQVRSMKTIQNVLAQRMIPIIKKLEQSRLYRKKK